MKTLTDTLKDLRGGTADHDAGGALAELIEAVRATGVGGTLILELKLKPLTKGDGSQLIVEDSVKVKKPIPKVGNTVLFSNEANELQARDPRQPELTGLREVGPAKVREFQEAGARAAAHE